MSEELEWPLATPSGASAATATGSVDRRTEGDVLMRHTDDGGEIECVGGIITLSDGLETSAYLSVLGGNEDDNGIDADNPEQFWANFEEPVVERRQRSRTQYVLIALPCLPSNMPLVEEAVMADLAWMGPALQATVAVEATIPAVDTVNIHVEITIGNVTYPFDFKSPWGRSE
jgi:hypothetical protein